MLFDQSPLELQFSLEPGLSDTEIELLWTRTQQAQRALDSFLMGKMSEFEMTDYLKWANVSIEEARDTLEENLTFMGIEFYQP